MHDALVAAIGDQAGTMLMITGVRQGESAIRDRRIEMSCSKDGAECGQGWYQQILPDSTGLRGRIATLAPILHWRVCHVWDWLTYFAPTVEYGGWPTHIVAEAYGGDEAEEINARTGCIGCPLAQHEPALDAVLRTPAWSHLAPLKGLKPLYRELREPQHRLRKAGVELLKDGTIGKNPQRMGPITFEARLMGLARVLSIQAACNEGAAAAGRPLVDILNAEEEARIRELIAAETWPQGGRTHRSMRSIRTAPCSRCCSRDARRPLQRLRPEALPALSGPAPADALVEFSRTASSRDLPEPELQRSGPACFR
jgi:DNA sulfur modification protein DndC